MLNVKNHSRDSARMTYVYPVVSRRAEGVSIGINLNINNACNWACVYCQVPDLKRGGPPPVDLRLLEHEFREFLHDAIEGDFMTQQVPPEARRLVDVAFSGNGEPTSATEFAEAVIVVENVLRDLALRSSLKLRLITNGSLLHRKAVQEGIARIGALNGEVWFKVDRVSERGMAAINGVSLRPDKVRASLLKCMELAPTWLQTCYFIVDGKPPEDEEKTAYLEFVGSVRGNIQGVHLYGLARPSLQPGAERLSGAPEAAFLDFARQISALGVEVVANP